LRDVLRVVKIQIRTGCLNAIAIAALQKLTVGLRHPVGAGKVDKESVMLMPAAGLVATANPRQFIGPERVPSRGIKLRAELGVIQIQRLIGVLEFLGETVNGVEVVAPTAARCKSGIAGTCQNDEGCHQKESNHHFSCVFSARTSTRACGRGSNEAIAARHECDTDTDLCTLSKLDPT
jgi:hypothetical protein